MQTDESLVKASLAGDLAAFEELVRRYKDRIYGLCRAWLGHDDAEDACQEAFVRAYAKLASLEDPSRFRPWLFAIARNEARRSVASRRVPLPLPDNEMDVTASVDDVEEHVRVKSLVRLARGLLADLSEANREVAELYYLGSLSMRDISEVLGVPASVVKSRLYESRRSMKRRLAAELRAALWRQSSPPGLAERIMARCGSACECGLMIQRQEGSSMAEKPKKVRKETRDRRTKTNCGCGCVGDKK